MVKLRVNGLEIIVHSHSDGVSLVKSRENGLEILVHSHSDGVSLVKSRIPFENRMMESFR